MCMYRIMRSALVVNMGGEVVNVMHGSFTGEQYLVLDSALFWKPCRLKSWIAVGLESTRSSIQSSVILLGTQTSAVALD